jgi:hypothetical protein
MEFLKRLRQQSVWQYDAVRVLFFSFVLFRENLFEPLRLVLSPPFIRKRRLVT